MNLSKLQNQDGSIIVASLVAVTILLILFLSAFSYSVAGYSRHVKSQYKTRSRYLAESGINRALSLLGSGKLKYTDLINDSLAVSIDGYGGFLVQARPFGAYLLLTAKGNSGNQSTLALAIAGGRLDLLLDNALVLTDHRYPLMVTGATQIYGDILSGPIEISAGQIDGQGIFHKPFHIGNHIIDDSASVISTSQTCIEEYKDYIETKVVGSCYRINTSMMLQKRDEAILKENRTIYIEGNLEINGLIFSSSDTITSIIVNGVVIIRGNSRLEGLIEIVSEKYIIIQDSSFFADGVCFAADSLILKGNCYFAGQGIAKGKLVVDDRARIRHPSLLLSLGEKIEPGNNAITISSREKLSTICMLITDEPEISHHPEKIYIDSMAVIEGVLYSSGYMDLRGRVYGSVITRNFWYYDLPTTYINWLRHAIINRGKLRYHPAMPLTFNQDKGLKPFSVIYH